MRYGRMVCQRPIAQMLAFMDLGNASRWWGRQSNVQKASQEIWYVQLTCTTNQKASIIIFNYFTDHTPIMFLVQGWGFQLTNGIRKPYLCRNRQDRYLWLMPQLLKHQSYARLSATWILESLMSSQSLCPNLSRCYLLAEVAARVLLILPAL